MATMGKVVFVVLFGCLAFVSGQMMPGGWQDADTKDNKVEALAQAVATLVDKRSNSEFAHRVIHLNSAQVQVVAGMKYRLNLDIGETNCRKDDDTVENIEDCEITDGTTQTCEAVYWIQSWLKLQTLESFSCNTQEKKDAEPSTTVMPPLLGGKIVTDTESEDVQRAASFAVKAMNARSNSLRVLVLQDVVKATKQTTSGTTWNMLLHVGKSACLKNKNKTPKADCESKLYEEHICSVTVQEQSWMDSNPYRLVMDKCVDRATLNSQKGNEKANEHKANGVNKMAQRGPKHPNLGGDDHDIGNYGAFREFQAKYNKVYTREDEAFRYGVFRKNMLRVRKLQQQEKGSATYAASKFADLTSKEFQRMLTPAWDISVADSMDKAEIPQGVSAPDSWDWRDHGAVTAVKNQGSCGSCWAFSTTGNIEGQWWLKKQELISLSEQELVDCDKTDQGCNGGLPANAYKAIEKLGGLETEDSYPYDGEDDKCQFNKKEVEVYINSSVSISSNEDDMKAWLYKNGPISIGINANAMQFYMGGVSHPFSFLCNPDNLDHGVLIVAYGTKQGWFYPEPFWTIKNSWGEDWGEKGYYLVHRGSGTCGLNKMPTSSVIY